MIKRVFVLALTAALLSMLVPVAANAATYYLRPDGKIFTSKPWSIVGAATAWEALDDPVTELETPSAADYISDGGGSQETRVSLSSTNILGVGITKASIWYYAANSQPVEVKSSADSTWQTTSSTGWNSRSQTIASHTALNEISLQFRTTSSSNPARQVRAAFLKIETDGPHVYWGAWMDGDVYKATNPGLGDAPWDNTTWDLFEAHTEKPVSIVHFGQPPPWGQKFAAGPFELAKKRGALPLVDMGTGYIPGKPHTDKEPDNRVSLKEINEGTYDAEFGEWAEAAANYSYPFFFRWGWEMNGTWFKWGKDAAAAPSEYQEAWRRIHDIAEEKGATNITWVWCPNVEFSGSTSLNELYPGDTYVDWTCLDGYNKSTLSFSTVFQSSYSAITGSIAPSKPLMIGETATVDGPGHHAQFEWIKDAIQSLSTTFPQIKAFVWFNWNIVEEGEEWGWPIEWTSAGRQMFAKEIASPYFATNEYGEPASLQRIAPLP